MSCRRSLAAGIAAGLAAVPGCRSAPFPEIIHAFVFGTVTAQSGAPVADATVVVEVFRATDSLRIGEEPTVSDGAGRYAILLAVIGQPFDALLDVLAQPSDGAGLGEVLISGVPVRFQSPDDGLDSARVDFVLPPESTAAVRRLGRP